MSKKKKPAMPYQLNLVAASDNLRPVLQYILVTKNEAVVTNGHILVKIKTPAIFSEEFIEEMPERILIHSFHWKQLVGCAWFTIDKPSKTIQFTNTKLNLQSVIPYQLEKDDPVDGWNSFKFPAFESLFPDSSTFKPVTNLAVGMNARYIYLITRATKCATFKFEVRSPNRAIKLTPISECEGEPDVISALVMPVMLSSYD